MSKLKVDMPVRSGVTLSVCLTSRVCPASILLVVDVHEHLRYVGEFAGSSSSWPRIDSTWRCSGSLRIRLRFWLIRVLGWSSLLR